MKSKMMRIFATFLSTSIFLNLMPFASSVHASNLVNEQDNLIVENGSEEDAVMTTLEIPDETCNTDDTQETIEQTDLEQQTFQIPDSDVLKKDGSADLFADNNMETEDTAESTITADSLPETDVSIDSAVLESDDLVGLNVDLHSQEDIKTFIREHAFSYAENSYDTEPSVTVPYAMGQLSSLTTGEAINALNTVRYIAGIPYDVVLKDSYSELAQAASLVNAVNNFMSHYPSQPDGMEDALYEKGYTGASSSNLAWGTRSLAYTVMLWMSDSDRSNIYCVGHRRWLLNPTMKATGFGAVGSHSAVYAFDGVFQNSSYSGVAWPAQNMPVELFDDEDAWSISFGKEVNLSDVKVTLHREVLNGKSNDKTWTFSEETSDGYFNVNNDYYGQQGCVIFRPEGNAYFPGDVYTITISGVYDSDVSYTVRFFEAWEDISDCQVSVIDDQFFSGDALEPSPTVTLSGKTLVPDQDYILAYRNNMNAGTATVIITGIGGYSGKISRTFVIKPASIGTATVDPIQRRLYTGNAISPIPVVKMGSIQLTQNVDYTLSYTDNTNVGTAKVIITGKGNYTGTTEKNFQIFMKTGFAKASDNNWYYYRDGSVQKKTDVIKGTVNETQDWWYTDRNGKVDFSYTGMAKSSGLGWVYVDSARFDTGYTGMAKNAYGWWYVKNGKLDQTYTGMAKNAYGWWYMKNGKLDTTYTGMAKNAYGWWYMKNGKLDQTYTGMAKNAYGWWYMKNGKLDQTYTGMAKNAYGWWYIKNGKLDQTYTGMAKNAYGWWYMKNGKLDTTFTGIAQNQYGSWYMVNGKLANNYNGKATFSSEAYSVKNGKATKL